MKKINCLIVDDEPLAGDILEAYINNTAYLHLVDKCCSATTALNILRMKKVDLVFLDIQMPKLTGLDFLRTLPRPPKVIITTAYREYALEGYELNVLDYLLKPIEYKRFLAAVNKFQVPFPIGDTVPGAQKPADFSYENSFIYCKTGDRRTLKILLKDILYIESAKDYLKIKTKAKTIMTYSSIKYLEQILPDDRFCRIHRSYVVAVDHISSFSATDVEIDKDLIPIGRNFRSEVMKVLEKPVK